MKILEDLHIFDFSILKLFIEDFPNIGIWWNKLVVADQYYAILYLIASISVIVGLLNNYKYEFADKHNSLNIFQWSEFSLHAFFLC